MKKKLSLFTIVLISCIFCFYGRDVLAATSSGKDSDISIYFEKGTGTKEPKPPIDIDDGGAIRPKPSPLPQTGELLTSFIFLLLGVAFIILVLGIITIKKVCELDYEKYEGVIL